MTATAFGVRMPCLTRIRAKSNPHRRLPLAESQMARRVCSRASEWTEAQASKPMGLAEAKPYRTSTLCRSREVVLVHPLGKVTAITNLKIKHCKNSPMSQKKPICPSFARQNFNQFIAQSDEYLASFLSVGFAFSSDFF